MSHQDRRDPLPKGYQFGDAHEHDYRARYVAAPFVFHAICLICQHDAGEVDMTAMETVTSMANRRALEEIAH